jgi:hypothetical protein
LPVFDEDCANGDDDDAAASCENDEIVDHASFPMGRGGKQRGQRRAVSRSLFLSLA